MTSTTLTHRGATPEVDAVKALLTYLGVTVEERVVPVQELIPMTKGHARLLFDYRGITYYGIEQFLDDLVSRGYLHW